MGGSINWPKMDAFFSGKSQFLTWMITRGTPMTQETPIFQPSIDLIFFHDYPLVN